METSEIHLGPFQWLEFLLIFFCFKFSYGFCLFVCFVLFFFFVVDFVIHLNEKAKGLHVFPIPIPPPNSLSNRSL